MLFLTQFEFKRQMSRNEKTTKISNECAYIIRWPKKKYIHQLNGNIIVRNAQTFDSKKKKKNNNIHFVQTIHSCVIDNIFFLFYFVGYITLWSRIKQKIKIGVRALISDSKRTLVHIYTTKNRIPNKRVLIIQRNTFFFSFKIKFPIKTYANLLGRSCVQCDLIMILYSGDESNREKQITNSFSFHRKLKCCCFFFIIIFVDYLWWPLLLLFLFLVFFSILIHLIRQFFGRGFDKRKAHRIAHSHPPCS